MQQSTCSLANKLYIILCGLALAFAAPALAQQGNARGPIGESPYEIISGWHTPFQEPGFAFGGNSGVWAESPDRIIIAQRGETILPYPVPEDFPGYAGALGINVLREVNRRHWQNCLYILNGDGEVVEIWDHLDYLCEGSEGPGPHRVRISPYDPESRIWLINETFHQIYVIANDGSEVLATYGEKGVSGDDETHFGRPQDVAFLPDGRILVADGLDNHRVIIFDNDMNYLGEFGGFGTGPGQFNTLHAIAIGPDGLIFALDRSGGRCERVPDHGRPGRSRVPARVSGADAAARHHRQRGRHLDYRSRPAALHQLRFRRQLQVHLAGAAGVTRWLS